MKQYHQFLQHILQHGVVKTDRTGTGTLDTFGYQNRYDLRDGFPLVTTKKVHVKSIIGELLWFISGSTSARELREKYGVTIWDEWQGEDGELGPVYGSQWRSWPATGGQCIDQLQQIVDQIRHTPDSRRIIVSAWNVAEIPNMKLPPCHLLFQFNTEMGPNGEMFLDLQLYQRSADAFLGVPFNIASYALLLMMVAQVTGCVPRYFIHTFGSLHIYLNHMDQVKLQLTREPRKLPTLKITPRERLDDFVYDDFEIIDYDPYPAIKAPVAI